MAFCDALISGSFAIQFFERVSWRESDLDVYIEDGPDAEDFEQYLCQKEGYHVSREREEDELYLPSKVDNFRGRVIPASAQSLTCLI